MEPKDYHSLKCSYNIETFYTDFSEYRRVYGHFNHFHRIHINLLYNNKKLAIFIYSPFGESKVSDVIEWPGSISDFLETTVRYSGTTKSARELHRIFSFINIRYFKHRYNLL